MVKRERMEALGSAVYKERVTWGSPLYCANNEGMGSCASHRRPRLCTYGNFFITGSTIFHPVESYSPAKGRIVMVLYCQLFDSFP